MLKVGRREESAPSPPDSEATSAPGTESPSASVSETPSDPGTQTPSAHGTEATSARVAYQRTAVYLTPDLRKWLRDTARALPDGLSASDVVRLALVRLRDDAVGEQVDLVPELVRLAHEDAERYAGRRNRGLPTLDE
jgi:hypothetical protein